MVCSHTGCGRYANQHAKLHAQGTGHSFSFELVTGRIWGYQWDTFVHAEGLPYEEFLYDDSRGEGSDLAVVMSSMQPDRPNFPPGDTISAPADSSLPPSKVSARASAASEFCHSGSTGAWFEQSPLLLRGHRSLRGAAAGASNGNRNGPRDINLPPTVRDKLASVTQNYEELLDAQLQEQRLFFEKMLAQETVRALERAYMQDSQSTNTGNSDSGSGSGRNNRCRDSTDASAGSMVAAGGNGNSASLDRSGTGTAAAEGMRGFETAFGMHDISEDTALIFAEIERRKMDISLLEEAHQRTLDEVREVEAQARRMKKQNDTVVRHIKALRQQEIDTKQRKDQLEQRYNEQEHELQQSISDLTFFLDTRNAIGRSANKEELQSGQIVMRSAPQPQPQPQPPSANNKDSGKRGRR